MTRLSLSLLGHFQATLDGGLVPRFSSNRARALLAYLAVEAGRPQPREALAGLLCPDQADRTALANLRYALSDLRHAIRDQEAQPPLLVITRDVIGFNPAGDCWLDVAAFAGLVAAGEPGPPAIDRLQQAAALYRGDFLEGFSLAGSPAFEEWVLLKREEIGRQALWALHRLAAAHEARGEYERAQACARRQLELAPWHEEAHQQLMRALALSGQRSAALAGYEACRRLLAAGLGIEPGQGTQALYESIRDETLVRDPLPSAPVVVRGPGPWPGGLLARERELAQLEAHLAAAVAGQGRVVFVTGEAGLGKTALMAEFARRATDHPRLVVAGGNCSAPTGIGDPYQPFREILQALAARLQAPRLWGLLPAAPGMADRQQAGLFQQVTGALETLARQWPLVLLLDDLQWADAGSVSLLFHLGRRLAGSRILLVGAYRPDDVALGRNGGRHPLEPVVNELARDLGPIRVDLAQAGGRRFVEAWLDREPNRLGAAFRQTLHRHTAGNPLFVIESCQSLRERGGLVRDAQGRWTEGPALEWDHLPARVEAVIAERIERLPAECRAALAVASVEGEVFTAEVVARVQGVDPREIIRRLSGTLGHEQHLVAAHSLQHLDRQCLSRYRFRHGLCRRYLYNRIDPVARGHLHQAVAGALEALHATAAV